MRRNISPTPTSDARNVAALRPYRSFTAKQPRRHDGGHGIAIVLSVAVRSVQHMVRLTAILEMPGSAHGALRTQLPLEGSIKRRGSKGPTEFQRAMLKLCAYRSLDAVQYANGQRSDYLLTTVTQPGKCAPSFARPAIRSLDGTSVRQKPSLDSRSTSRATLNLNQPCHADILLEIANAGEPSEGVAANGD